MGIYVVKTMRQASWLINEGFEKLREQPDRNNPKFKVFLFNDSVELRSALERYKNRVRN
jgi:hypothetical protein